MGGVLEELDRLARPSTEHVVRGKDRLQKQERATPGELDPDAFEGLNQVDEADARSGDGDNRQPPGSP
jgi:hypothetical protein